MHTEQKTIAIQFSVWRDSEIPPRLEAIYNPKTGEDLSGKITAAEKITIGEILEPCLKK